MPAVAGGRRGPERWWVARARVAEVAFGDRTLNPCPGVRELGIIRGWPETRRGSAAFAWRRSFQGWLEIKDDGRQSALPLGVGHDGFGGDRPAGQIPDLRDERPVPAARGLCPEAERWH